jgi:hypothetical protein
MRFQHTTNVFIKVHLIYDTSFTNKLILFCKNVKKFIITCVDPSTPLS